MKSKLASATVAAILCAAIASTSFAQGVSRVDLKTDDRRTIREIPELQVPVLIEKGPQKPAGDVMNWAAVAAVAAAVVAVTSVVHHAKESWFPGGIENPVEVINPVSEGIFDIGAPVAGF